MCLLAYIMFFLALGLILLITDLLGWTCFFMVGPYNARIYNRYVRNRDNRL
jgi:uncharacterized membrane protein